MDQTSFLLPPKARSDLVGVDKKPKSSPHPKTIRRVRSSSNIESKLSDTIIPIESNIVSFEDYYNTFVTQNKTELINEVWFKIG